MKYTVLVAVKSRQTASMYANSSANNVSVGTNFESTTKVTGGNVAGKPADNGVVFVQMPDTWWIPMVYNGVTYLKEESSVTPPPTTDPYLPKKVTVENDGGVYVSTNFTKV